MFTQCPHCHAIYRLDAHTLAAASGRVQCGDCEHPFDALAALRDELPGAAVEWQNTELPFTVPDNQAAEASAGNHGTSPDEHPGETQSATHAPERPGPPLRQDNRAARLWPAASLLLGAALAAQMLFLAPHAMANHDSLRPVARFLCGVSGCKLPPRQALDQLRLASRDVRAHPSVPGALIISATLVNEADFTQPYPVLEISLGDLQGQQMALRRFSPEVYVPESVDVARGMAPESRVQVSLEVVDPGEEAVAFRFAFRSSRER